MKLETQIPNKEPKALPVAIIILAAGESSRFGSPKQLALFEGETLIRRAVRTALDVLPDVIVVTGFEHESVRKEIEDLPAFSAYNSDWEKGMGSSIAFGLRSAIDRWSELEGVVIHLCDMPLTGSAHLKKLVDYAASSGANVVFMDYLNTSGVPAYFRETLFSELLFLDGDRGAKAIINECPDAEKAAVRFEGKYADIDSPEDLERVLNT